MDEDRLARLELRVVEEHVLDGAEGHRRERRADGVDAGRSGHEQAGGQVDLLAGEAVEMESVDAADILAEIVAAFAAGAAEPAGARAVDRDDLARQQVRHAVADRVDLAGRLRADDERHLALGEGHAAPAPDVDVVERHRPDTHGHLADAGGAGRRHVDDLELAVFDELQCAHDSTFRRGAALLSDVRIATIA